MNRILKIIPVIFLFAINNLDAQQVVKNDTISGTPLSISMDKKVDDLLGNLEEKCLTGSSWNEETPKTIAPKIAVPEKELSIAVSCILNHKSADRLQRFAAGAGTARVSLCRAGFPAEPSI